MTHHGLPPAAWLTGSYRGQNGACVEVAVLPAWHTSSQSGQSGSCVEVAYNLLRFVAVRDSKDRKGPVLSFRPDQWRAFTAAVKGGEFALP